jgi:hypothetical protein
VVVTMGGVLFETDQAHVKSGGMRHLGQLAAFTFCGGRSGCR